MPQDGSLYSDVAFEGRDALSSTDPAVEHLRSAIGNGKHWYLAVLEAIGMWRKAEEMYGGRAYHYLIAGEAFDWLLLAERLCDSVPGAIAEDEKAALLFRGRSPISVSTDTFKELIGFAKYRFYLNYFYGVTAEEALVLAVEDEVRKEKMAWGYCRESEVMNEAYRRIYGPTFGVMLKHFLRDKSYPVSGATDLTKLKEFAYWRFKFRIKMCEKAKVASDSRKAVNWLRDHGVASYTQSQDTHEYLQDGHTE
jgi:hypothetical protein